MTHEETAMQLLETLTASFGNDEFYFAYVIEDHDVAIAAIAAALAACARATIEHCAQAAEVQAGGHYMARICAAAIRALTPPA